MDVRIIVETTAEMGSKRTHELRRLSLSGQRDGDPGLKLEDAKDILLQLPEAVLNAQIEDISEANRRRPDCNRTRRVHDYRTRMLDTLFVRFRVRVPRLRKCSFVAEGYGPFSPFAQVFPDRAAPELRRLQAQPKCTAFVPGSTLRPDTPPSWRNWEDHTTWTELVVRGEDGRHAVRIVEAHA